MGKRIGHGCVVGVKIVIGVYTGVSSVFAGVNNGFLLKLRDNVFRRERGPAFCELSNNTHSTSFLGKVKWSTSLINLASNFSLTSI